MPVHVAIHQHATMPAPLIDTALDPRRSVVVEACAGSGKTWLLVSRMLRLLLDGAKPAEILAITFTRKAAQEMQTRLTLWLRELATAPDAAVHAFLAQRGLGTAEIAAVLPRARTLFETVLTARPGVTVNTFHGWFLELLQHAPLSAGAAGQTALAEQTAALLEEAWQSLADELASDATGESAQYLTQLLRDYGLHNTRALLHAFLNHRAEWLAFSGGGAAGVARACATLRTQLGIDPDADPLADFFTPGVEQAVTLLAQAFANATPALQREARALDRGERDDASYYAALRDALFTKEGIPRDRWAKAAAKHDMATEQAFKDLCERVRATERMQTERAVYRSHVALYHCGAALLEHYERLKAARGQLDFVDVEWRAWQLLAQSDHAEYMQYKLDARYRHILVDEFQDTNPLQWQALKAWLEASAAAGSPPTVFLVGDPKQSIYRFRGAEPRLFDEAADYLQAHYGAARLDQDESRRCAPAIIEAVNRVFTGRTGFAHFRPHTAHRSAPRGGVRVLPLAEAPALEPTDAYALRNPLAEALVERHSAHALEAAQIAQTICALVGRLPIADGGGERPARFGDIMVLARGRAHLAHFEDAFKAAGVPYVSARRGGLLHTQEVLDLTALLEFLVTPFADLKLAHVLKSPLLGADDDDLLVLAARDERTWWQRLAGLVECGEANATLMRAHALLRHWRALADRLPVHDLLDRIYADADVIAAYARAAPAPLQGAVIANLHAFIELALNIQGGRYPSLPKFLQALRTLREAPEEESPDEGAPAAGLDAVRIHTVHGAKGLEAPVVFLIDAHRCDRSNDGYGVLVDWVPGAPAPRHFSACTRKEERGQARATLFAAREAFAATEHLNLLYVAMTRAQHYLIVSGSACKDTAPTWHSLLSTALGEGCGDDPLALAQAAAVPSAAPAPRVAQAPEAAPATAIGERRPAVESDAIRRGIALHRLLECMTTPATGIDRLALRLELALAETDFDALWQEAQTLIATPALARFFDAGCYRRAANELPYVNAAGELKRIDRLVEFDDAVWILDYKMGEAPAADALARAAARHRPQLEEYRRAMASAFPGKRVRAALIFAGGLCYELPE